MLKITYNFIVKNHDKSLTIRAFVLAAIMRIALHFLPISKTYAFLGIRGEETPDGPLTNRQALRAAKISFRVDRVANRTPWESKCFVRALVAQHLLKTSGLSSTLYLGVGKDESERMIAHAWIRCGSYIITGGGDSEYAVVAKFARYPKSRRVAKYL